MCPFKLTPNNNFSEIKSGALNLTVLCVLSLSEKKRAAGFDYDARVHTIEVYSFS